MKKKLKLWQLLSILIPIKILTDFAFFMWFTNVDAFWNYPIQKDVYIQVNLGDVVFYDELDAPPEYVLNYNFSEWFEDSFAPVAIRKLKKYMKDNNLCILPGGYAANNCYRINELIELFNFDNSDKYDRNGNLTTQNLSEFSCVTFQEGFCAASDISFPAYREIKNYDSKVNVLEGSNFNSEKIKKLWLKELSYVGNTINQINRAPIYACYNLSDMCWIVYSTIPVAADNKIPVATVKENGDVFSVGYFLEPIP